MEDNKFITEKLVEIVAKAQEAGIEVGNFIDSNQIIEGNYPDMIFWLLFTIFVLACFVGYYVVWRVTPALQSPLMSVSNAISGIVIVGALLAAGSVAFSAATFFSKIFGLLAVFFASINIFGGFVVSQRMLAMFKKKK